MNDEADEEEEVMQKGEESEIEAGMLWKREREEKRKKERKDIEIQSVCL